MASNSLALFLTINVLFFALASGRGYKGHDADQESSQNPNLNSSPTPTPTPTPSPPATPTPSPPPVTPNPSPSPPSESCTRDALQFGLCVDVLDGLLNVTLGQPPVTPCCSLLDGLVDLEAAICLCTALKANILGINLNLPISLSLLLNVCSRKVPSNFQCA